MFAPATKAREIAVPVMLVPEALIVWVPAAPPPAVGPIIVMPPAEDDSVILEPAAKRIGPDATVVIPDVDPPAVMDEIPKLLTKFPWTV